jgi:hypothetical protein
MNLIKLYHYAPTVLSIFFGCIAIAALIAGTFEAFPPYVVGENLILVEIHILPGFYLKPMTLFTYSFFLAFAFGLYTPNTLRRAKKLRPEVRRFIYIIACFLVMASGFEIIYHIVLWSAALAYQGLLNPDIIVNPWPQNRFPINVVFAAKLVVMIFSISIFVIDYLNRIEKTQRKQATQRAR